MRQGSMLHSGEKYFSVTSAKVISLLIHQEDDSDIATTNLPEQLVTESAQHHQIPRAPAVLLQPIKPPHQVWEDLSMNFVIHYLHTTITLLSWSL